MRRLVGAALAAALLFIPVAPANADGLPVAATAEAPAVVSNRDGVEVFVVGADRFVYHAWNDRPADNSAWSAWHRLGNQKVVGAVAAVRHRDDSLEVFARADDDRVVHIRRNCFLWQWCDWEQVAGGMTLASPAVVLDRFGSPELFVHGQDHRPYRAGTRDGRWQGWEEIRSPQLMRGSPSASRSGDGSPQVLFEGANGQIFRSARGTGGFTPATQLGRLDERPLGRLAVTAYEQDGLWLPRVMTSTRFGVFATNQERNISTGALVYSPWGNEFGAPAGDGGAGASDFVDGAGVLYTRFTDNSYRRQRHLDGFTGGWERVGDGSFSGPPAVINLAGKHFVFGRGLNGHLFVSGETGFRQRTWSGWHLI